MSAQIVTDFATRRAAQIAAEKQLPAAVAYVPLPADLTIAQAMTAARELAGFLESFATNPFGEHMLAEVQAAEPPFVPAYSQPENEVKGSKYQETRDLGVTEIAALMRKDIAAAITSGAIPKGTVVSVKTSKYSMGCSIDVRVTALPGGLSPFSQAYMAALVAGEEFDRPYCETKSDGAQAILNALTDIHAAYNRDNSDSMSDYYDRRYAGDVRLCSQLERRTRDALVKG